MSLLEDGKVFYIKCGIKDYIDKYGNNYNFGDYFTWAVTQFSESLNIDFDYFDIDLDNLCFSLPYINEPFFPYTKFSFQFQNVNKNTILSGNYDAQLKIGSFHPIDDKYYNIYNNFVYKDSENIIHYNSLSDDNKCTILNKNNYTVFVIDTNFLDSHGFYSIGIINGTWKIEEGYAAPAVLICDMFNKFNKDCFDGIIFLNLSDGQGIINNESSSFIRCYKPPSISALIPIADYDIETRKINFYNNKGFLPQIFTADEDSFSIVKIHFGKIRPVKNIYLTKSTNSALADFSYYQNMLTEKNAWKKFMQIDEFNNKKTFVLGLNSIIQNDIDLESSSNWIPVIEGKKEEPQPEVKGYLEFSSDEDFYLWTRYPSWNGTIEYSVDNGSIWRVWDGRREIYGTSTQSILLRGTRNSIITGHDSSYGTWTFTGKYIEGNIETLLDYQMVLNGEHPSMLDRCYSFMFTGCTSLTKAPELPATTLTNRCYSRMFNRCRSLIKAPELPAITLADYCYAEMFYGCTSLIKAPKLPATELADYCYYEMFYSCTSLIEAPKLPATTLTNRCYNFMFYGCTSLTKAPKLPATILANYCYSYMFNKCTSLIEIPELPATELVESCYSSMFSGCKKIKISITQSAEYPYEYRIPKAETGIIAKNALENMFYDTGGTVIGTPVINFTYYTSNKVV